ncbi:MAG TPA: M28 family peptidase, partial [Thermoanaerobaculia bacterium]|nr:M28 family peptidase [Thermoanaerobaculia bacterium]
MLLFSALLTVTAGPLVAAPPKLLDPLLLVQRLAALGPRPAGSGLAHREAKRILLAEMKVIGLSRVRVESTLAPGRGFSLDNLSALVPGGGRGEIVLSAHYDSVPAGPGADDDASGCAVVLRAAQHLLRAHLRHHVRVLLFDGE